MMDREIISIFTKTNTISEQKSSENIELNDRIEIIINKYNNIKSNLNLIKKKYLKNKK